MRLVVGISLLLVAAGILSCDVEGSTSATTSHPPALKWIRTTDGWEHPGAWNVDPIRRPTLHPLVVAAGQSLASILALVAFRRDDNSSPLPSD